MKHLPNVDKLSFQENHTISISDVFLDNFSLLNGELSISPKKIRLKIIGEINPLPHPRKYPENHIYNYIRKVVCKEYNFTLYLFENKCITWSAGPRKNSDGIYIFNAEYDISYFYIVYKSFRSHSPTHYEEELFQSVEIHSPEINAWLGATNQQHSLVVHNANIHPKDMNHDLTEELPIAITDIARSLFIYDIGWFSSFIDHKVGFSFSPHFFIHFNEYQNIETVSDYIQTTLCLFYILTGKSISIDKVILKASDGSSKPHIYFHRNDIFHQDHRDYRSPIFNYDLFLTETEEAEAIKTYDKIFRRFYTLSKNNKILFKQFIRLQSNTDFLDKFIGYFRIVEQLTPSSETYCDENVFTTQVDNLRKNLLDAKCKRKSVNSLIKRILQLNNGKINTETRFERALNSLPKQLQNHIAHWKKELSNIVRLRNDISHGNIYSEKEETIANYSLLLELVALYSLWDLVGLTEHPKSKEIIQFSKYWKLHSNNKNGNELGTKIAETNHCKSE